MLDWRQLIPWSDWIPLDAGWRGRALPDTPGLYRIRRAGRDDLDYIGQTGEGKMTLYRRIGMLKGIVGPEMPYRDPHTAGPALWALRHTTGCSFEVSVASIIGTTPWRKGLEALAISLYRQDVGVSPTINFGRMPTGYHMSSGRNRQIIAAGRLFRGGPSTTPTSSHAPSIAPAGPLTPDPTAAEWCGHVWSPWVPLSEAADHIPARQTGLYRIRDGTQPTLLYIGQGLVRDRLQAHLAKTQQAGHLQGQIFGAATVLSCSWVLNDAWLSHQLLELENDLIAAHVLHQGVAPPAQFLG